MRQRIEYNEGDKVGNCIFIKELPTVIVGKSNTVRRVASFRCICGNEFNATLLSVRNEHTTSCGCIRDNKIRQQGYKNKKHGMRNHPLYKVWRGIIDRCTKPNHVAYHNYGGRGINVCSRWQNIENFIEDMYPTYARGLDIDRIDNDDNYTPTNCRWITRKQNSNNMRVNRIIDYNGEKRTLSEWSDYLDIPYKRLIYRVNNWNVEQAFTCQKLR